MAWKMSIIWSRSPLRAAPLSSDVYVCTLGLTPALFMLRSTSLAWRSHMEASCGSEKAVRSGLLGRWEVE